MKIRPTVLCVWLPLLSLLIGVSSVAKSDDKSNKNATNVQLSPGIDNIIPIMDGYYKALNKQLDRHIKNRVRDPFANPLAPPQPSNEIRFKPQSTVNAKKQDAVGNLQKKTFSDLPAMSFRGVTESAGKKLALLEIDGLGTFVVQEGDKVGLQQVVSSGAVLHILEINDLNLIVETGSYGQQMVVQ